MGVSEPYLMRMAHGAPMRISSKLRDSTKGLHGKLEYRLGITSNNMLSDAQTLRVCKRFYVALILSRLVQVYFFVLLLLPDKSSVYLLNCGDIHYMPICVSFSLPFLPALEEWNIMLTELKQRGLIKSPQKQE